MKNKLQKFDFYVYSKSFIKIKTIFLFFTVTLFLYAPAMVRANAYDDQVEAERVGKMLADIDKSNLDMARERAASAERERESNVSAHWKVVP